MLLDHRARHRQRQRQPAARLDGGERGGRRVAQQVLDLPDVQQQRQRLVARHLADGDLDGALLLE